MLLLYAFTRVVEEVEGAQEGTVRLGRRTGAGSREHWGMKVLDWRGLSMVTHHCGGSAREGVAREGACVMVTASLPLRFSKGSWWVDRRGGEREDRAGWSGPGGW